MICMVLGKQHMEGKNKAGKDYNFHKVFVSYDAPDVAGQACRDLFLQGNDFDYDSIAVGGIYDAVVDFDGRLAGFNPVDLPVAVK